MAVKREFLESSTISTHYKTKLFFQRKSVWRRALLSNVHGWIVSMGAIFIASNYLPQLVNGYSLLGNLRWVECQYFPLMKQQSITITDSYFDIIWKSNNYSFSRRKLIRYCWYLKTAVFYTHMRVENEIKSVPHFQPMLPFNRVLFL